MKYSEYIALAKAKGKEAKALAESGGDAARIATLLQEGEAARIQAEAIKSAQALADLEAGVVLPVPLPDGPDAAPKPEPNLDAAIKAIRFGDVDTSTLKVLNECYGVQDDYRQLLFDQNRAFGRYLRTGQADRTLGRQLWGAEHVKAMLRDGLSVAEIKATMIEGADALGGYAVPPDVAAGIIQRTKGLTAVRDGGATVVQTASKVIEWLEVTGGGAQYPSGMRGYWGAETKNPPTESNFTFGLTPITVHIYTYKVPMSVSLLEDASNITSIFTSLVADTLAIDEDSAFLVGDGNNKPEGILPGQANALSLSHVHSGAAAAITMSGLRKLRRGVASQYRAAGRASWIANGATGGLIEDFTDGAGRYFVEDALKVGDTFLGATWRESEALPDVSASVFPIIYGNLSGYTIVERLGMAIQRYNDSNTGINTVQFHIRRRLGGKVTESWKLAVQEVAA